jgi:hypothetical protein
MCYLMLHIHLTLTLYTLLHLITYYYSLLITTVLGPVHTDENYIFSLLSLAAFQEFLRNEELNAKTHLAVDTL